jgi:2,4-dienoyl-CoA reductase-like NADH-dependent reductase (Old Yellow Enzyme family)
MSTRPTPLLFQPLTIRSVTLPNRIAVSPMCQYSAVDGFPNDWHLVHLGGRAAGGAGLIITEAIAVEPAGRITHGDLGIWRDEHIEPLRRIVAFLKSQGSVPCIQLAHAGRKASTDLPWKGGAAIPPGQPNGWQVAAPSPIPFFAGDPVPRELSPEEIGGIVQAFRSAARRALAAGFDVVEIHSAHGYLLHEFLSPLSNRRTDAYGGSFENRTRALREVVEAVRGEMGPDLPLLLRISATDWTEGGWTADDAVRLARLVQPLGVDLVDTSSGGNVPDAKIPAGPGFQVPFAERVRTETGILTGAVGLITSAGQAEAILAAGQADIVLLARELLRDPYFPIHAAQQLGVPASVPRSVQEK